MILSFTGHRAKRLGDDAAGAWIAIKEHLLKVRPDEVISGMASGVDTMAFDIAVDLGIPIIAAVPWTGFVPGGDTAETYLRRLERATRVAVVSESPIYHHGVFNERDRWMVDNSEQTAAIWDGVKVGGTWYTMEYARKSGRPVEQLKWRMR